jgi:hypothetical protein
MIWFPVIGFAFAVAVDEKDPLKPDKLSENAEQAFQLNNHDVIKDIIQ